MNGKEITMTKDNYFSYGSKWGEMIVCVNQRNALKGLWFTGQKYFPMIDDTMLKEENSEIVEIKNDFCIQMKEYEEQKRKTFSFLLEPEGTNFQQMVWELLQDIPYGETTTYGEIARQIAQRLHRNSMSFQAVGQAVGHNPLSILIPCHRVLGKNGQLTGYAGGLEKKIQLLELEGVKIRNV